MFNLSTKKALTIVFACIFWGSFFTSPAFSAEGFLGKVGEVLEKEQNKLPEFSADLPKGMSTHRLNIIEKNKHCPDKNTYTVSYTYLKGSGNETVDALLKKNNEKDFATKREEAKKAIERQSADDCNAASLAGLYERNYAFAFKPSDNYLSVLIFSNDYTGGAHGNQTYESLMFDLKTAEKITLKDIFPDLKKSGPLYLAYQKKVLCEKYPTKCPCSDSCSGDMGKINLSSEAQKDHNDAPVEVLSEKGISLIFGPYVSGPYSDGTRIIDIPKEELIKMGASSKFWE